MKFEKKLPSTTIKRLLVTKEIVDNPEREIKLLLKDGEGKDQEARYNKVIMEEKTELKESLIQGSSSMQFLRKYFQWMKL